MKTLILGSNGMLGHITYDYLKEQGYEVYGTAQNNTRDIIYDAFNKMEELEEIIKRINPELVINCIGILNKAAEDNKVLAVKLNSLFPHYIDQI